MASYFAAQLKDMFFGLVERVTGYGWSESHQDGAGKCSGIAALKKRLVFTFVKRKQAVNFFTLTACRSAR
jgi:hypothetical protein